MTTGEKIQKLRKDRRITQEEFADRLGVSRQSVSKWETDQAYPETETVLRIAKEYGVSCDYLLKSGEEHSQSTDKHVLSRFRTGALIAFCSVPFAYFFGLILSFAIDSVNAPLIGFAVELGILFFAVCAYAVARSMFLTRVSFTDAERKEVSAATARMIYAAAIALFLMLPLAVFRIERVISLSAGGTGASFPLDLTVTVVTPLTGLEYLALAPFFGIGGYLTASVADGIRRMKVFAEQQPLLIPHAFGAAMQIGLGLASFFAIKYGVDFFTFTNNEFTAYVTYFLLSAIVLILAEVITALCFKRAKPFVLILAVGFAGAALGSCGLGILNLFICFVLAVTFGIAMLILACVKPKRSEPFLALNAGICVVMLFSVGMVSFCGSVGAYTAVWLGAAICVSLIHGLLHALAMFRERSFASKMTVRPISDRECDGAANK